MKGAGNPSFALVARGFTIRRELHKRTQQARLGDGQLDPARLAILELLVANY